MSGAGMTDDDWLRMRGVDVDIYEFSERVGIILGDDAVNPAPEKLEHARLLALQGRVENGHVL